MVSNNCADAVDIIPRVESHTLTGCSITDRCLPSLVATNQHLKSIRKYMLTVSGLSDDGLKSLCDSLLANSQLCFNVLFFESLHQRRELPCIQQFIAALNTAQFIGG